MRGFDNKWMAEACTIADALLKQAKIEQTDHSYLPMYLPDAPFREWQLRKKLERKPTSSPPQLQLVRQKYKASSQRKMQMDNPTNNTSSAKASEIARKVCVCVFEKSLGNPHLLLLD